MSVFDFPTWAYTKLAGKPEEPPKVQPMPTPTLDEIEAMQKAEAPKRKPGRQRKPAGAME